MKDKEIRKIIATDLEVRQASEDEDKVISGYINKFNCRSQYMGFYEEVSEGAFDKTLADGHNIFAMYNHNNNLILGSTRGGSLRLNTDKVGLRFELKINDNISYARDLYELVRSGDVDGCSFGFYVRDDSWSLTEEGIDLRTIKEVELIECTITPFPAYLDSEASCRSYEEYKESIAIVDNETRELELIKLELELI